MSLAVVLLFPTLWAVDSHAAPLKNLQFNWLDAQFESPPRTTPLASDVHCEPAYSMSPTIMLRNHPDSAVSRHGRRDFLTERFHLRPRSLSNGPSNSSSISHPLGVGIAIGVASTVFVLALALIFRRVYRWKKERARTKCVPLRLSQPREFTQIDHFTASQPSRNLSSSMRVAHRGPDGSWSFADAPYGSKRDARPDSVLLISPTTAATISPIEFAYSAGTAFSYADGSSSKTGPPPYVSPEVPPPMPPRAPEKSRRRPFR